MARCIGLLLIAVFCQAAESPAEDGGFLASPGLLADYNAELRGVDGRLDVDEMIARLTQLRVDTYFYLIWHRETDWEDLKLFLPAAREAGIDVWPYLVPPSESPPLYGTRYSEPFRLDYVRWGEEIAKLSLLHPNLKAFVIDDFYTNRAFYTPEYVGRMRDRARFFNPNMRFLPLMYYPEIDREFVEGYRDVIDGVVAAYPQDAEAIRRAWRFLNDRQDEPARYTIVYPWQTRSTVGMFAAMRRRMRVLPGGRYEVRLTQRDDYTGPTAGYHFKELLIDGQVVWEEDVAGGSREWEEVVVDVTPRARGKSSVDVAFRVYDRKGVSNFGVEVEAQEMGLRGLEAEGDWEWSWSGPWRVGTLAAYESAGRFRIPLVVMIAGDRAQFVKRNGEPASVDRIRDKVRMAISQMRQGYAAGVVTYALKKDFRDEVFGAIWQLFLQTRRSASADFDGNGRVDFEDFLRFAQAFGRVVGNYDRPDAAFDLDMDGRVGFGDFVLFSRAYRQ